jgi:hypothetical protein
MALSRYDAGLATDHGCHRRGGDNLHRQEPLVYWDPVEAAKIRHKFYDMASAEKALVVGFHFNFPSLGYAEKDGAKYCLVPIAWNPVI